MEAGDLGKICGTREIENVDVIEDFETVEAAKDEDTAVRKASGMVSTRRGWSSNDRTRLVL